MGALDALIELEFSIPAAGDFMLVFLPLKKFLLSMLKFIFMALHHQQSGNKRLFQAE
jgi:hypothetical protein